MKRLLWWIAALVLFSAMLWLGWSLRAANTTAIDLDLIWVRFPDVEIWRAILVSIGVGAATAALLVGFAWLRGRLLNRRYRRAIGRLESELHELRSLPLMGSEQAPLISTSEPR